MMTKQSQLLAITCILATIGYSAMAVRNAYGQIIRPNIIDNNGANNANNGANNQANNANNQANNQGNNGGVNNTVSQFNPNQAAGVEIDANGILRTRIVRDLTGKLAQQRMAQMRAALDPNIAQPSRLRKVSLNRLETALADRLSRGAGVPDDMMYLAGLTAVENIFFFPETNDIVIAGPAEGYVQDLAGRVVGLTTGQAILQLQDLVVALRAFAPGMEPTRQIGCSIDPTPEGLQRMQQFLVNISGRITPRDASRIAQGLRENLGLQTVSIRGVSPNTHFAQILVEADYRMKLIGIGLERPPVKITSYVQRANPASVSRNALQRWYFVPDYDSVRVSQDGLAVELVGEGVKLIGADELVGADGTRAQSGRVDRASQAFVTSFTKKYAELARTSPVYAQLRNLIDMVIAAAYIQQEDFYSRAGWDLGTLANEQLVPVEAFKAPQQVESAVNVVWKGRTLMTPIGGGVSINAMEAMSSNRWLPDENGQLKGLRESIRIEGLAEGQWWWD